VKYHAGVAYIKAPGDTARQGLPNLRNDKKNLRFSGLEYVLVKGDDILDPCYEIWE